MTPPVLAPREFEYLRLRGMGRTQEAIALDWGLAVHTVKTYAERTHRKLGVSSVIDAFRAMGWLRVPE